MPKVSVVIPVFNRGDLVRETIDSVLAQTYRDFEVIAINDGSTDHSLATLQSYGAKIKILSQVNCGQGAARNAGINIATGQYVAFLDSDDVWMPLKLQNQVDLLDTTRSAWIYSGTYKFTDNSENVLQKVPVQFCGDIAPHLLLKDFIVTSTVVVRREIFLKTGLFTNAPKAEDWDLWLRIAAHHPIEYIAEPLAGYRLHTSMVSSTQSPLDALHYRLQAVNNAVSFAPEVYQSYYDRSVALQYIRAGNDFAVIGELKQARKMYRQSLKYHFANYSALVRWVATFLGKEFITRRIARNRARSMLPQEEQ